MRMEDLLHHLSDLSPSAAGLMVSSVWQGLLLSVLAAGCLRSARSLSSSVRSVLWTMVMLATVVVPVISLRLPHTHWQGLRAVAAPPAWSFGVLAAWAALSAFRAVQFLISAFRLRGLLRRAVSVRPESGVKALLDAGPRPAKLCTSDEIARPSVAGFWHPQVIVPPDLLRLLTPTELQQVVLHEMEHLRRRDDWTNLFQQICLILLPLNPVVLWLDQRLCRERELACDDGVLRSTQAHKAYAACLVRVAEAAMVRRGMRLALAALGTHAKRSELAGRVERILDLRGSSCTVRAPKAVTAGLLAGVLAMAVAIADCPQLVRFQPATRTAAPLEARMPERQGTLGGFNEEVRPKLVNAVGQQRAPLLRKAAFQMRAQTQGPKRRVRRHAQAFASGTEQQPVLKARLREPRLTLAEYVLSPPVYAAVPWQDGWLIVQL